MNWWQRVFRRQQQEQELQKELSFHLEQRVTALKAQGMSDGEAYRRARHEFGSTEQVKEECRDARSTAWIETALQDLRYAARLLRKSPVFTLAVVGTLALTSGANIAIFQLFEAVALRSLPVPDPDRLTRIRIHGGNVAWGITNNAYNLTHPLFEQIREHRGPFSHVAAWQLGTGRIGEGPSSRKADLLQVSGEFFDLLDLRAAAGRLLSTEDDVRGCATPAVVLSNRFWRREFGDQAFTPGKRLFVNGQRLEVLGVTPASFTGPEIGRQFDVALPLCSEKSGALDRRDQFWLDVIGRLKPGWTFSQATAYLQSASVTMMQTTEPSGYGSAALQRYRGFQLEAVPGAKGVSHLREQYDKSLTLLLGITGLVLLLASANLTNMMLVRAGTREREFAVRTALGAVRSRLVRQALAESLLLSSAGVALGLLLARVLSATIIKLLNTEDQSLHLDLALDWKMVLFSSLMVTAVCVVLGVLPGLRSARAQPGVAMKASGRSSTGDSAQRSWQRLLVVLQVAISLILVTGALLFVRSFHSLVTLNPGFREGGILAASFDLSQAVKKPEQTHSYRQQLLEIVRSTPQVEAAASTSTLLIGGGMWSLGVQVQGVAAAGNLFCGSVPATSKQSEHRFWQGAIWTNAM